MHWTISSVQVRTWTGTTSRVHPMAEMWAKATSEPTTEEALPRKAALGSREEKTSQVSRDECLLVLPMSVCWST